MTKGDFTEQRVNVMAQQTIHFTKMHGAGNDYIYVNTLLYNIPDPGAASVKWSDRHKGIGADGLVTIGAARNSDADFAMRIFNADGSEAMMCGNASRCVAKYLYEKGLTRKTVIRLDTLSGVKTLHLHVSGNTVDSVTVDMLCPGLHVPGQYAGPAGTDVTLTAGGRSFKGTFVSMRNPHFVIFTPDVMTTDVALWGAMLESHEAFPHRCNIEFARTMAPGRLRVRVWERGSGITQACGTGACATAVAAAMTGRSGRETDVVMDGGTLNIRWNEADNHVYMTGGAEFVFEGDIAI